MVRIFKLARIILCLHRSDSKMDARTIIPFYALPHPVPHAGMLIIRSIVLMGVMGVKSVYKTRQNCQEVIRADIFRELPALTKS